MGTVLKEYLKMIWKRKLHFFTLTFLILVAVSIELTIPIFYKDIANILAEDFSKEGLSSIMQAFLTIILLYSIFWVSWRIFEMFVIKFELGGIRDLDRYSFSIIIRQKYILFQNEFSGSIMKKIARFVYNFEVVVDWFFFNGWQNLLAIGGSFIVFFQQDSYLATIFLIWSIIYIFLSASVFLFRAKYDKVAAKSESKIGSVYSDMLTNIFTVKTSAMEDQEQKTIYNSTEDSYKKRRFTWIIMFVAFSVQGIMMISIGFFYERTKKTENYF